MRRTVLILGVAAATLVMLGAPAGATPSSPVTDVFVPVSMTLVSGHTADGNTFATYSRTGTMSGTFTGTCSDTLSVVVYADAAATFHIAGSCTVSIDGRSGTFAYVVAGSGVFPTSAEGHWTAFKGTGGLAGIHLEGPFTGDFTTVYLGGQYHFE